MEHSSEAVLRQFSTLATLAVDGHRDTIANRLGQLVDVSGGNAKELAASYGFDSATFTVVGEASITTIMTPLKDFLLIVTDAPEGTAALARILHGIETVEDRTLCFHFSVISLPHGSRPNEGVIKWPIRLSLKSAVHFQRSLSLKMPEGAHLYQM